MPKPEKWVPQSVSRPRLTITAYSELTDSLDIDLELVLNLCFRGGLRREADLEHFGPRDAAILDDGSGTKE